MPVNWGPANIDFVKALRAVTPLACKKYATVEHKALAVPTDMEEYPGKFEIRIPRKVFVFACIWECRNLRHQPGIERKKHRGRSRLRFGCSRLWLS